MERQTYLLSGGKKGPPWGLWSEMWVNWGKCGNWGRAFQAEERGNANDLRCRAARLNTSMLPVMPVSLCVASRHLVMFGTYFCLKSDLIFIWNANWNRCFVFFINLATYWGKNLFGLLQGQHKRLSKEAEVVRTEYQEERNWGRDCLSW